MGGGGGVGEEGERLTPEASNDGGGAEAVGGSGRWVEQESGRGHTHHQQPEEGGDEQEVEENGKH